MDKYSHYIDQISAITKSNVVDKYSCWQGKATSVGKLRVIFIHVLLNNRISLLEQIQHFINPPNNNNNEPFLDTDHEIQ